MKRSFLIPFLAVISLVALTGCAAHVHLAQVPIASIQVTLSGGPGIAPGEKWPLVVKIMKPNGAILATEGKGGGEVQWKDLTVKASVVAVNGKGVVSLPSDPRKSDGKFPHVAVIVSSHPGVRADLDIPVRYDRAFGANFRGANGFDGTNGVNGMDGSPGSMGSTDPEHPSPGGNGTNGGSGTDGGDGGNGLDGPMVQVRVALRPGPQPLLQVSASASPLTRKRFLIDPQGGSLTVMSDGGEGGKGGKGGRGGRGGAGGIGSPSGTSGSDGLDGRDGIDGHAGNNGFITVIYDSSAKPYLGAIRIPNGRGRSEFKEAPVAPLW
jgi:hypothetical protein